MKMIKKTALILILVFFILPLGGCWNYRGLNEMSIVSGLAIDKNPQNDNYMLTFEIMDMTSTSPEQGVVPKLIEAEGTTIFDAIRNAKDKLSDKLYFGNMIVVVISNQIAQSENIGDILDFFLRDAECRESINVVVSQEPTAKEILSTKGTDNKIISIEIQEVVEKSNKTNLSTVNVKLYQIYTVLRGEGVSLTLPAFHNAMNSGEKVAVLDGIAVFDHEKLLGYLSPTDSKYFLFATDKVEGGLITFSSNEEKTDNTTLEISKNKTKLSYTYENGKLKLLVSTKTDTFLGEIMQPVDSLNEKEIKDIQKKAEDKLRQNILDTITKVQAQFGTDIFGFGDELHEKDYKLWNDIKKDWNENFKTIEVDVNCKINILNSGALKKTRK